MILLLDYIYHLFLLVLIGYAQYFKVVRVFDWRLRIVIVSWIFYKNPEFIVYYLFGYDYYLSVFYQYNTKGTGLNAYYPEADTFDRAGLALYTFITKSKTVTLPALSGFYLIISLLIIIHILYLIINVFAGSVN